MRKDKEEALSLRLQGHSYGQINQMIGVPKSTLSDWFSNLEISDKARMKIEDRARGISLRNLIKRNKAQTHIARRRKMKVMHESRKEVAELSKSELLIVGASLYWAEGYKKAIAKDGVKRTYHPVSFANSDPEMVKLFMRFLREVCEVPEERIRLSMRIYQHQSANELTKFWMGVTGLPESSIQKTYYGVSRSSISKKPFNRLKYGTVQVRVNDTNLFHRIMGWIEGLKTYA